MPEEDLRDTSSMSVSFSTMQTLNWVSNTALQTGERGGSNWVNRRMMLRR